VVELQARGWRRGVPLAAERKQGVAAFPKQVSHVRCSQARQKPERGSGYVAKGGPVTGNQRCCCVAGGARGQPALWFALLLPGVKPRAEVRRQYVNTESL